MGICVAVPGAAQETPVPELTGRVVDEAELLSAAEEAQLEEFLVRLEAETSVQLVLVSVPRIEGAIEDYSLRLAEAWQIGQAETDNGALVVVSRDDRRARIEVGYGLEPVIPDGLAGRIIRDELAPRFGAGDYAGGFAAAAMALAQAAEGGVPRHGPARGNGTAAYIPPGDLDSGPGRAFPVVSVSRIHRERLSSGRSRRGGRGHRRAARFPDDRGLRPVLAGAPRSAVRLRRHCLHPRHRRANGRLGLRRDPGRRGHGVGLPRASGAASEAVSGVLSAEAAGFGGGGASGSW